MSRPRKERILRMSKTPALVKSHATGPWAETIFRSSCRSAEPARENGARSQAGHRAAEKCPKQKSELNESGHAEKS